VEVGVVSRGERVCVSVTDSGPGIPADFQERVFERFAQADTSSTRQQGGTGLGLSITKAIVERHHGRIWFRSEPEAGTTFFFDLPVWVPTEELPVREPVDGVVRILVCEDDHDVARLLTLMLEREGYEVDVAYDAEEAKRLLALGHYSALTLDLMLPGQDGISLLRELLAQGGGTLPLPVVVVSAWVEKGKSELNGNALEVIDWLAKPINQDRLAEAVRRAIQGSVGKGARILHVEDDADLRSVVAAIVGTDAAVESAGDLEEARRKLAGDHFDLVLLDLALPDGSGLELLPLLSRADPPTPVVIFSAHEVDQEVAGQVASVLVKSQTSNPQLLERIRSVLAGAG